MDGFYLSYEVITITGSLQGTMHTPITEKTLQINEIFTEILENQRSWITRSITPRYPTFKVLLFYADKSFNRRGLLMSKRFNCELTFNEIPRTPMKVDFKGETK